MPLSPGTRIGPYTVTAAIGAGGMGEVYRARDATLDRDVALKVLPQNVSGDTELLGRLQREARTLAALNHPNMAHIYGLENADGLTALVMELVEGPTLADSISTGAIHQDSTGRNGATDGERSTPVGADDDHPELVCRFQKPAAVRTGGGIRDPGLGDQDRACSIKP